MLTSDDRARYLESGTSDVDGSERLDMIRDVLADPLTWAEAPAGIAEGIAAAIDIRPEQVQPSSPRWWRVPALVGGVALVLVAVLGWSGVFSDPPPPDAVAVMRGTGLAADALGTASVRDMSSGWSIRLVVEGLPPAPVGTYYEGWAWNDAGEGVSIGTFHFRDGAYPVILWAGVDLNEYPSIWVTFQEEGAGPEASDQVMMRGRIEGLSG